ncbi:hypothetical protein Ahy_A10g048823 [Arachis hypogaea]|uniref:Aminotransferase-like plant mobile domain-containing protein n=1 Tax=Arachis hypogaea TaxID=3818 RepID=A0A445B633_ARAHY|nr:hypothetical protein Ahy_A10g048823 [Arachis hypogaea]
MYRLLCRASRFDCKKIDSPLTLLLAWAWLRLPHLAPVPREPCPYSGTFGGVITPFSSSNKIVNGTTTSNKFSQTNFTPSDVCNEI